MTTSDLLISKHFSISLPGGKPQSAPSRFGGTSHRVLIVIAHHETPEDTIEALSSLMNLSGIDHKIVVLDNGSSDKKESKMIQDRFPSVTVIRSEVNLGSAEGLNVATRFGLTNYDVDFVLFLDSDVIVAPTFAARLVQTSIQLDSGITGANILSYENPDRSCMGGRLIWQLGLIKGYGKGKDYRSNQMPAEYQWVDGTAMLVRKDVLETVGFLNPRYTGWEDIEYCVRARRKGFKVVGEPRALVWHKRSGTRRRKRMAKGVSEPVTLKDVRNYAQFSAAVSPHPRVTFITAAIIGFPLHSLRELFYPDRGVRVYKHARLLRTIGLPV